MAAPIVTTPGTMRPLWRLVWPVLVEQLLGMLIGLSDTLLAGQYLDRPHLAAMANLSYVLWALTTLFAVISVGTTALTARFVGANDYRLASRVANQSYAAGAALAAVVTVLGLLLAEPLIRAMQLDPHAADLTLRYLGYILPVLPAVMLETVGLAALRGSGDMVTGLVTMILVNVVNIAVSWTLLSGAGPIPAMGWDGIAIGTASGHLVGGLIPCILLLRGRSGLKVRPRWLLPDREMIRRILRIGVPGGMDAILVVSCQLFFLSIINRLGELATAAHGVAIRIESLAYLPGTAFQLAAATLAGQYLGARDYQQASRSVLSACLLGSGVMLIASVILFFGSDVLVRLFLRPEQYLIAAEAARLLRIISFVMLPFGIMMILNGALRGAGDTRWPLVFTFLGFLGVRVPLAYLLAHSWDYGIQGAWYAMCADLTVRCLLVVYRFRHGGWKRIEV